MYLKRKFTLLENAVDSLKIGIDFYLNENLETAHKHAILNVYHSIELLLKEKLLRFNPIFIYRNTTKKIDQKSQTVGLDEILILFKNLGLELSEDDEKSLISLKEKRNNIIHFEYHPTDNDADLLGISLKFIKKFLEDHLSTKLKDIIDADAYLHIEEIVDAFEERYKKAVKLAQEIVSPKTKDDLSDIRQVIDCPECGTPTLPCIGERTAQCTLCEESFNLEKCYQCGGFSTKLDEDLSMCTNCVEILESRIRDE